MWNRRDRNRTRWKNHRPQMPDYYEFFKARLDNKLPLLHAAALRTYSVTITGRFNT